MAGIVNRINQVFSPQEAEKRMRQRAGTLAYRAALAAIREGKRQRELRSAPLPPQDMEEAGFEGMAKGYRGMLTIDERQQSLISSMLAQYERVSSAAGWAPPLTVPMPEVDIPYIAGVHSRTDRIGQTDWKADLDSRVLRYDEHLQSVDRIRRAAVFKAPIRIKPANSTPLAVLVANGVRAILDNADGLASSLGELGMANGSGFAVSEVIWRQRRVRIPIDATRAVTVLAETVASLESVHNRHLAFDIVTDRPYLRMSNGFVDIQRAIDGRALRKFVFHKGFGDGPARSRGFQYAAHYLYYLTGLSVEKWAIVVSTYGVSTPYLSFDEEMGGDLLPEDIADAEGTLCDIGKGSPRILRKAWGDVKTSPVPSGMYDVHEAIIGYLNAQKSKLVVSNTLTQEMGGQGSYNASSTHGDQQIDTQQIDLTLMGESLRTQLCRFIVEKNAKTFAAAFSTYVAGGCTPEDVRASAPKLEIEVNPSLSQPDRLKMFIDGRNAGIDLDEDQIREECSFRAPIGELPTTGQSITVAEATRELRSLPAATQTTVDVWCMLLLPLESAEQLAIAGFEPAGELHLTVGHVVMDLDRVTELAAELAAELAELGTVMAELNGHMELQCRSEEGQVAVAHAVRAEGAQLEPFHDLVNAVLSRYGHVDERLYQPHVTLAYQYDASDDPTFTQMDLEIPQAVHVTFTELALSIGSDAQPSDWVRIGLT